jgi:hypothetical protein
MRVSLIILTFFVAVSGGAQTDIDTLFSGYVDYKVETLRKDSSGVYYRIGEHPDRIYYWSKTDYLRIFDLENNLLVEGQIGSRRCSQLVLKTGKWVSYYPGGNIKTEGYYQRNNAIGLWRHFFANQMLKKIYTLSNFVLDSTSSVCMAGTYEEYYENGQLKITGLYEVGLDTSTTEHYYSTFVKYVIEQVPVSKKSGTWLYYLPNGELERKETY